MLQDADIERIYNILVAYHSQYLQPHGVRLPTLRNSRGNYIRDALVLVYLAQGYPDTKSVTKQELTEFIRHFYPDTADVQQARHLACKRAGILYQEHATMGLSPEDAINLCRWKNHIQPIEYNDERELLIPTLET